MRSLRTEDSISEKSRVEDTGDKYNSGVEDNYYWYLFSLLNRKRNWWVEVGVLKLL